MARVVDVSYLTSPHLHAMTREWKEKHSVAEQDIRINPSNK